MRALFNISQKRACVYRFYERVYTYISLIHSTLFDFRLKHSRVEFVFYTFCVLCISVSFPFVSRPVFFSPNEPGAGRKWRKNTVTAFNKLEDVWN